VEGGPGGRAHCWVLRERAFTRSGISGGVAGSVTLAIADRSGRHTSLMSHPVRVGFRWFGGGWGLVLSVF
jgi:hypothetical protein